jgi:hypothetical protein
MIYFISIGILVLSIILFFRLHETYCPDLVEFITFATMIIFILVVSIMTVVVIKTSIDNEATANYYNAQYESYTTQIKSSYYKNDNNLGASTLYTNITTYNQEVSLHKAYRNSIWVFNFYEKCYEDMPLIEIPILNN